MTDFLLIRHAVNDFVKTGKLAGWTPGVSLNEKGQKQAKLLGERLADAPITQLHASPLERTMETAQAIADHHPQLEIQQNTNIAEVKYGDWQGAPIRDLFQRKMWHVIQEYPSRAYFPNGETMRGVQVRAVNEIERMAAAYPRDTIAIVFHADVIKMILAHFLGVHLDNFQRIVVSPASISIIHLGYGRPYIATMNDTAHLLPLERAEREAKAAEESDAANS